MDRKRALRAMGLLLGIGLLCCVVYWLHVPCLILARTGFYCAGCGTQRMLDALLQGDVPGAFRQNPFMFCALPLGGAYLLWEAARYVRGRGPLYKKKWVQAAFVVVVALGAAFAVLRNLPGFERLAPVG